MTLSETVDATYADQDAGDAQHQQDHDVIHNAVNAVDAAYASSGGFAASKQAWLEQIGTMTPIMVAVGDESSTLTTGTAKVTFRAPFAFTLTSVRANVNTASTSGVVTVDLNESGVSVFSTKLTIDQGEKTSATAATGIVISDAAIADDAEMTVDIDTAGTGAAGLKITIYGTRA